MIDAALRGRIPYLDFAAEPQAVLDAFERFDAPAHQAGFVIAPGLAVASKQLAPSRRARFAMRESSSRRSRRDLFPLGILH
jgi:hypothetical protein